jgi:hypothetical protein
MRKDFSAPDPAHASMEIHWCYARDDGKTMVHGMVGSP